MIIISKYLSFFLLAAALNMGWSQDTCTTPTLSIFGQQDSDERGKSLIPNLLDDGVYVVGFKDDSVLIIEATLNGGIRWAKTLDIFAGRQDHATAIMRDNENMLVISGMSGDQGSGGTIFCLRYDPFVHKVLWTQEYFIATKNYSFSIIQDQVSGNFLLVNNPHDSGNNDCEILQLNKTTGNIIPDISMNYHYGGSDQLIDVVYYKNFIYGTGRFTEGASVARMRHTIAKIDPSNGKLVWIKMGHFSSNVDARLYGWDLIIENDEIYSIYSGDPSGTSSTDNKLFLQKTDLNGNLQWVKQYELPGQSDDGYEMIKSGNGIVVLGGTKYPGENIVLFKIDFTGNVIWSKAFEFSALNSTSVDRGASQLIEIDNHIIFTGVGYLSNGSTDLVLVKTDLSGNMNPGCITNHDIQVQMIPVSNPVFTSITPEESIVSLPKRNKVVIPVTTVLSNNSFCVVEDTLTSYVSAEICEGQSYLGYSEEGQYADHFITSTGCDSVRFLDLSVTTQLLSEEFVKICLGDTMNGQYTSGIYSDTFYLWEVAIVLQRLYLK